MILVINWKRKSAIVPRPSDFDHSRRRQNSWGRGTKSAQIRLLG